MSVSDDARGEWDHPNQDDWDRLLEFRQLRDEQDAAAAVADPVAED